MKLLNSNGREPYISLGLLLLRLTAGATMLMNHGIKKIYDSGAILEKGFADPFHIGPKASLWLTIFAEAFCPILIILGLLTRWATIPLIIAMCVALFYVNGGAIFGKGESAAIFLGIFLTLLCTGPGKFSLDRMIGK